VTGSDHLWSAHALADVAAGGKDVADEGERGSPGDQGGGAGGRREEMPGREAEEAILGMDGRESAHARDECEEEVLDDEAPGEEGDDRADLVAEDRAESNADCAPERARGERSAEEEGWSLRCRVRRGIRA
jgi:hypothetical protein